MNDDRVPRVLLVDDEPDIRFLLGVALAAEGWIVEEASSGAEALERCRDQCFTMVVLDQRMPGPTGIEVARELVASAFQGPIVLFSAYLERELVAECAALGVLPIDKLDWTEVLEAARTATPALRALAGTAR